MKTSFYFLSNWPTTWHFSLKNVDPQDFFLYRVYIYKDIKLQHKQTDPVTAPIVPTNWGVPVLYWTYFIEL